jgi:transcriptional regulator with XRE-family HTH domain
MESLGSYVATRRRTLGLTQQNLADALGYSVQAISKFENGLSQMDLSSLPTLAKALSLSLDELVHQSESVSGVACSFAFDADRLAKNLVFLRAKKGLTQQQAGEVAHISARSLANYEKGLFLPSLATVLIYLDYYQVSADGLFGQDLRPVVVKETKVKRPLWRWLAPVAVVLVAVIVIGSTSPLWFAKAAPSDSSSESEATSEESTPFVVSAPTTSYSADNIAGIYGIKARVNNALSATLCPGTYSLSVAIQPSNWYDDSKFAQIGWSVDSANTTDESGAYIETDATNHTWNLKVKDNCVAGGKLALKPYVKSLLSSANDVYADSSLGITFSHTQTIFPQASDPIDDLIALSVSYNGLTDITLSVGQHVTIDIVPTPITWSGSSPDFEQVDRRDHPNSFINVNQSGGLFHGDAFVMTGATKEDVLVIRIGFVNWHTYRQSVFSNPFTIRVA